MTAEATRPAAWNSEQDDHEKLRALIHAMMGADEALGDTAITTVGAMATAWRTGASAEEMALLGEQLVATAARAARRQDGEAANQQFEAESTQLLEQYLIEIGRHTDNATMERRLAACDNLWPAENDAPAEHPPATAAGGRARR